MTIIGWLQAALTFALVAVCVRPLGTYMYRVFNGQPVFLTPIVAPVEGALYRMCRISPEREMGWRTYVLAMFGFSLVGLAYLYTLLRTQAWLPLNPQHFGNFAPRPGMEHRDQLSHQHKLAVLLRRVVDELLIANDRPGLA